MTTANTVEVNSLQKINILCVFSRILGGSTFSSILDKTLALDASLTCEHLDFNDEDYGLAPNAVFGKLSSGIAVAENMGRKLQRSNVAPQNYDLLFFQSYRVCVPFIKDIKVIPTIVALDATPKSARRGNKNVPTTTARLKAIFADILDLIWYKRIFRTVDFFLARTEIVRTSLVLDYGVAPEKIAVTYSPMEMSAPTADSNRKQAHLLFVGNDFNRKGGPFLLNVFEKYLMGRATLTIISKDVTLLARKFPDGVKLIPGLTRDETLKMYNECDIFVMPTWKDEGGIAICEAMAAGLPVVVRDAGGAQPEFVEHGKTGFLLPYHSSEQDWAEHILRIVEDEELKRNLSAAAAAKARQLFDYTIFRQKVKNAIDCALQSDHGTTTRLKNG